MPSLNEYAVKAKEVFDDLINRQSVNSIYVNGNYWQVGNVYDTLLDYMQYAVAQGTITQKKAQDVNKDVLVFYDSLNGCWYDDYCWWIIALAKSRTYGHLFYPADITKCGKIITDAWAVVSKGKKGIPYSGGAVKAFAACDKALFGSVMPLYEDGTWQYDIYLTRSPADPCDDKPSNPIAVKGVPPVMLGPYQLSVINGLYLVAAQRLSSLNIIPVAENATRQYNFIKNWMSSAQSADDNLLNPFDSGGKYGLVRERVSKYLDGKVEMTGYKPTYLSWAGDQGTFIGGLYDYFLAHKDSYCTTVITKILLGVKHQMTMPFTKDNVSYNAIYGWSGGKDAEYGPADGPMCSDPADYSSGLGVFMRYLYYCCQDQSILSIIQEPAYLNLVRQTAEASYYDAYPTVSQEVPMFRQFNRLASLLAALRILPS